ncbi:hypothetical protein ACFSUJ_12805 [Streptomyces lusitanus]|uniref:Uncharacterized protein n=1 Tax=Streptomyces lusitanus TaxID=68232 RepID=A0ABU3JPH0_9ACTN|nr:hypothetical protein [Streptomyces lusitanus]
MLAEEYGYQVSPRPAAETPGVREQVEQQRKTASRLQWSGTAFALVVVAVMGAMLKTPSIVLAVAGAVLLGTASGYVWNVRMKPTQLLRLLETSRWQVWPCRLEEVEGKVLERRLVLLAPDRSVAAVFRGQVPHRVWMEMTDGRGVLWIAGDLRFPAVAAVPGGEPLWNITPEKASQRPQGPTGSDIAFDALVSEARSAVVWNMWS